MLLEATPVKVPKRDAVFRIDHVAAGGVEFTAAEFGGAEPSDVLRRNG